MDGRLYQALPYLIWDPLAVLTHSIIFFYFVNLLTLVFFCHTHHKHSVNVYDPEFHRKLWVGGLTFRDASLPTNVGIPTFLRFLQKFPIFPIPLNVSPEPSKMAPSNPKMPKISPEASPLDPIGGLTAPTTPRCQDSLRSL